ncbi:hypothetical protein Pla144_27020 [Bythopirellula polymerisocia]|uniref:PEP-CTERM protein-sorting domain-containing protein n=2 Tax=Bythopirellula polymerisocia TaxID=2528003 RepID=A0A5C6CPH3_9BACT|nr:hypothetical protein Pla144_27020 [Bythopirellula polymerisocia]
MMRKMMFCAAFAAALGAVVGTSGQVKADTLITDFNNFVSDALYPSWALPSSTIVSGPNSYDITATGYGSNYKYIGGLGIVGAGNNKLELTVTLEGPPAADGQLGPLVQLIDDDGTNQHFNWYGQTLGSHVLTMDVQPDLNLNTLTHMHMELDPGGFGTSGAYTVKWENLRLINTIPEPSSILLLASSIGLLMGVRRR